MPACLAKIAGMASSSKRRRASSSKKSSGGTARVISVKATDALPRKGSVSTGQRKRVVQPPIAAPMELLAAAVAGSKKKAQSLPQTKTSAGRTKTTRATGRASGKLKKPAAMEPAIAPAIAPEIVTALEPVAETIGAVEPAATANEVSAMTPLEAREVEALAFIETELEVEASAILEEMAIVEAPVGLPVEAVTFPSNKIGPPPVPGETRRPPWLARPRRAPRLRRPRCTMGSELS